MENSSGRERIDIYVWMCGKVLERGKVKGMDGQ